MNLRDRDCFKVNPVFLHPVVYREVKDAIPGLSDEEAFEFVADRSRNGDTRYHVLMAICFTQGIGTECDPVRAIELIELAKNSKNCDALALVSEVVHFRLIPDYCESENWALSELIRISPLKGNYMLARFLASRVASGPRAADDALLKFKFSASKGHVVSALFYSYFGCNSRFHRKARILKFILGRLLFSRTLSNEIRFWRYRDLLAISPSAFSKCERYLDRSDRRRRSGRYGR